MKNLFLKIKRTKIWKNFIMYAFKPLYTLIWEFIINFEGKFLYINNIKNKKNFLKLYLADNDKFLIEKNLKLISIASKINENLNKEFLDQMKSKIKNMERPSDHYLHGKENYKINMFPYLNEDTQETIINFAIDEWNINFVAKYLKVLPVISSIYVNLNIPIKDTEERGPMLWHKDDFGFKSLDLFLPLKDMSEESGPLFYMKKKNELGIFHKYEDAITNPKKGERNKIDINTFENSYKNKNDIRKFIGKIGEAIFIDSFNCYHRGGFCSSKERLMMRITYQTPDSLSLSSAKPLRGLKEGIINKHIKMNNKINNYILFKRNFFFNKTKFQKILIKFYKLIHFKDSFLTDKS